MKSQEFEEVQHREYHEAVARNSWERKVHTPLPGEILAERPRTRRDWKNTAPRIDPKELSLSAPLLFEPIPLALKPHKTA